jgi:hypothetical protein
MGNSLVVGCKQAVAGRPNKRLQSSFHYNTHQYSSKYAIEVLTPESPLRQIREVVGLGGRRSSHAKNPPVTDSHLPSESRNLQSRS